MRLSDSRAEARFRGELASWLDDHHPAADRVSDRPRSPGHIPEWARDWQQVLFDAGWLVPRWPPELGGRDASAVEQMIYLEELSRRGVPRTVNLAGLDVCAPTLADHGTGPQLDDWLPATVRAELSWCVAGVADADGDVTGEFEVPTDEAPASGVTLTEDEGVLTLQGAVPAPPGAADADRCLCAARVEGPASRVEDVAVLAIDLAAEGVSRPPAAGEDGAAVLAFDGVVVGEHGVIGERDQGWPVLQSLRARIRSTRWITSLLAVERALDALTQLGHARGLADDGVFRDTLARLRVEGDSVRALAYRALAKQETGRPNPELAMLPLATAQAEESLYLAGLEAMGADGLDMGLDGPMGWPSGSWAGEWVAALTDAAAGGGLAAERDRVAGRVLGLRLGGAS